MPNFGFKHTEASNEKNRLAHLGKTPWNKGLKGVQSHTEEHKKIQSKRQTGKKHSKEWNENIALGHKKRVAEGTHWLWKGGTTKLISLIRECYKYSEWRRTVFLRDNYTCIWCGDSQGGNLQADHIKPLSILIKELNIKTLEQALTTNALWDIANGRTLCIDCHKKTDTYFSKMLPWNKKKETVYA